MRPVVFDEFLNYHKNMNQAVADQISLLKDLILETIPVEQIYLFGSYAFNHIEILEGEYGRNCFKN
jgi:hypothetical protein